MIKIIVNGKNNNVNNDCTITELLELLEYKNNFSAVALNGSFVPLKMYKETKLKECDEIEILAPMSGG